MNLKTITAAAAVCFTAVPASAQDWYALGSAGQSSVQESFSDKNDTGYKIQLGYQFNPYFAIEGGYVNLGKFVDDTSSLLSSTHLEAKVSGANIDALGIWPVGNQFSLFGKLGLIDGRVKIDSRSTRFGVTSSQSKSATKAKLDAGFGAIWNLTPNVSVRGEWQRFAKLGDNNTGEDNVNLISVGVALKF